MLVVLLAIFVADTKILCGYNFVAPLKHGGQFTDTCCNFNAMDRLILDAIHYLSTISKKKVRVDTISTYLNNKGTHNIGNESVIKTLN